MRTTLVIGIIICAMTVPALAQRPEGREGMASKGSLVVAARVAAARAAAHAIAEQEEQQYRRQISTGSVVGGSAVLAFGTYVLLACPDWGEDCDGDTYTYTVLAMIGGAVWLADGLVGRQVPVNPSLQWSVTPGGLRLSW